MVVGAKNLQKELVDVNNLWHWPTAESKLIWRKAQGEIIDLPVFEWLPKVEGNGTVIGGVDQPVGINAFGEGFVEVWREGGIRRTYMPGVFLPPRSNGIEISFDIDEVPYVRGAYFMYDNGKWTYAQNSIPSVSYDGKTAKFNVNPLDSETHVVYAYLLIFNAESGKEIVRVENIKVNEGD